MTEVRPTIKSFFIDYYDHWFPARWEANDTWERRGDLPPYKPNQFAMLERANIPTVTWGTIGEFRRAEYPDDTQMVVYWDPKGHAGRGKELVRLGDCWYPDMWASVYIPTKRPEHTRILHIGDQVVAYRMWSDHEWQSNSGSDIGMEMVEIEDVGMETTRHFNWPLYAIDYVAGKAVDLNRCPGLSHTPVEAVMSGRECADAIIAHAQRYDWNGNAR